MPVPSAIEGLYVRFTSCVLSFSSLARGLFDIPDKRGRFELVHDIGLGGAVVVSFLRRSEFYKLGGADGRTRLVHIRDENSVIL